MKAKAHPISGSKLKIFDSAARRTKQKQWDTQLYMYIIYSCMGNEWITALQAVKEQNNIKKRLRCKTYK